MNRTYLSTLALLLSSLVTVAPEPAWAQGDPGEVLDLAVHQGPNTVEPGVLLGNVMIFSDGSAQGNVMLRGREGLFLWDVYAADVTCLLGSPGIDTITLAADTSHVDEGPPATTENITIVITTTDIPACLIWDIADGNVHDAHTDGAQIQIFNDPCP